MSMIKKEVKQRVIKRLEKEQWEIRRVLDSNRRKINGLSEESTKLKRELAELQALIRDTDI